MYDNTKLVKTIKAWLKSRCNVGYGQVYTAALLADFENYCRDTGALKASPGFSAFGREMTKLGFGRKRVAGLWDMTGLELKKHIQVSQRRRKSSLKSGEKSETGRKNRASKKRANIAAKIKRAKGDSAVVARMKKESKKTNIAAGEPK